MTQYRTVKVPEELLNSVEDFIRDKKELGYRSPSEFVIDATRRRMEELFKTTKTL